MYKTLLNVITNPYLPERKNPNTKDFAKLLVIFLLAYIPLNLIISFVSKKLGITHVDFSEKSTIFILYGVFLAPVIEEFIFRSWFKWSRRYQIILIILFFALIALSFIRTKTLIYFAIMLILGIILFFGFKSKKARNKRINKHTNKVLLLGFFYYFWISSCFKFCWKYMVFNRIFIYTWKSSNSKWFNFWLCSVEIWSTV